MRPLGLGGISMSMLWHAPICTICIAPGRTWGAGADLLVAYDERLALDGASFRFPGPAFGIVLGSRWRSERIDVDRAREVLTRGLEREAPDALAADLVRKFCPGDGVVRVEPPKSDVMRQWPPISNGYSGNFASVHRGERWVTLDLKRDADREVARVANGLSPNIRHLRVLIARRMTTGRRGMA